VTRSGGHQYCGFSSGNQSYIQILVDVMVDVGRMVDGTELSTEPAAVLKDRPELLRRVAGQGGDAAVRVSGASHRARGIVREARPKQATDLAERARAPKC
jgi:hypothetical protein